MNSYYPLNIPNEELMKIAEQFNRSKSSIVNKIQKLKKKFSFMFQNKSDLII